MKSKQEQPTVTSLLLVGGKILEVASIESNQLDAEILLAYVLGVERTWLRSHDLDPVDRREELLYLSLIGRRSNHEPIAYIVGVKEFYGYDFKVTSHTLVPRPESETIISYLIDETRDIQNPYIIDIGTGSGSLGITAKLKIPEAKVLLTDISHSALEVARKNADNHQAEVGFAKTDLLDRLELIDNTFIMANLPYVDKSWDFLSKDISHEPSVALFAEEGGLKLIYKLINQIADSSAKNITLFLESDTSQQLKIQEHLALRGFNVKNKSDFVIVALKSS